MEFVTLYNQMSRNEKIVESFLFLNNCSPLSSLPIIPLQRAMALREILGKKKKKNNNNNKQIL